MRGDARLGALVRTLRTARGLTLAAVGRHIGCAESLLSQVETGVRGLQPWLAEAMDTVYGTGGTITVLAEVGAYSEGFPGQNGHDGPGPDDLDVILVRVPQRGITVPVSRRELLAVLGISAATGALLPALHRAVADVPADEQLLAELEQTVRGLQSAGRVMPPAQVIRPLTGQVALIDAVRRRAPVELRRGFCVIQARCAESLSWLAEEAGDLFTALYWTDRAQHWAMLAGWPSMVAYGHVRRSMLAISYASDGHAAVEQAMPALHNPNTPKRIRGLATKQIAYGYALTGQPDASKRALELTVTLFDAAGHDDEDGPIVGQHSVNDPDLLAIFQATCAVYLGGGEAVVAALVPRMAGIGEGSRRTRAITGAKLARAYAHAGEPGLACRLILDALDGAAVDSLSTRSELRRALPALECWPQRDDVREARHRLGILAPDGS